jgi:hypothetical protein
MHPTSTRPNSNSDANPVAGAPCDGGTGHWEHMTGDDADHYGTQWLCSHM